MQGDGCWKGSFSVREGAKSILRVQLKYMKDVSFHEMKCYFCNAEDRFSCVRAFLQSKYFRASMHRITS